MSARAPLLCLALSACGSGAVVVAPPEAPRSGAWVFAVSSAAGVRDLYAFDAAALPDPLTLPTLDGDAVELRVFAAPLAELMSPPAPGGAVERPAAGAPIDLAWPLPTPGAAYELDGSFFVPGAVEGLAPIVVPRPPCPPRPRVRPLIGLDATAEVSSSMIWDGELWLATTLGPFVTMNGVYKLPRGASELVKLPALGTINGDMQLAHDGTRGTLLRGAPGGDGYELIRFDRDGALLERAPSPVLEARVSLNFKAIALQKTGADETLVGLVDTGNEAGTGLSTNLVLHDAATREWRVLRLGHPDAQAACPATGSKLHLELDGPRTGLVGLVHGPLMRFDLDAPGAGLGGEPYVPADDLCRNGRAVLADGVELVSYSLAGELPSNARTAMLWRRPGAAWARVETSSLLSGQAVGALGDLALVGVEGHVVALFEHVAARPEIPPRQCYELAVGAYPHRVQALDDRRFVVTGYQGGGGAIVELDAAE